MKKFFVMLTVALAATAMLTSCDDDDKKDSKLAQAIEGTHGVKCDVKITLPGAPEPTEFSVDAKVIFTRIDNKKVKIALDDFILPGTQNEVPVEIESVSLTGSTSAVLMDYNGKVKFAVDGTNFQSLDGTVKGTITPPPANSAASTSINLTVKFTMGEGETLTTYEITVTQLSNI